MECEQIKTSFVAGVAVLKWKIMPVRDLGRLTI